MSNILSLSRIVPERTKTMYFRWVQREWMLMSQEFRDARKNMKPMDKCFWCKHKFKDGEMMALANAEGAGNKLLCNECVGKMDGEVI